MKKLKFLYLEKEVHEVDIISKKLKEEGIEFTLKHVNSMKDFEQEINLCNYDIIFSCYSQPPCNCLNALEMTRSICPDIPFIIISKDIGEDIAIEAYKLGATDFIHKRRLSRLVPSITRAMFEVREREQRWQAENMKNKYDFIINTSKSFFSLIDKNYTYEAINKAFCQAHNLLKEEIIGKTLSEVWGERSFRDVIKPNLDKSFANHEVKYQAWFETPKSGIRCYEVTFYPYKDEHGVVTHTVVDTIDITERKEAEISLTESEEKYRNLVEMAQDGILIIVNGKIIYTNPVLFQMSGYEKDDFLGQPFQKFIHPSEVSKIANNYIKRITGKEVPNIYDSKIVKKDGTIADVEINASIINYSGQKALLIILRDITDRKKTEERNRQHTEDITLLNELNNAVNEGKSLSQLMDILSNHTRKMFEGYGGQVYLLSEDKQYLVPIQFSLTPQIAKLVEKLIGDNYLSLKIKLKKDSVYRHILQSGMAKITNSPKEFKQHIKEFAHNNLLKKFVTPVYHILNIKYLLSVPLITKGEPIGILDISKKEPFNEIDVQRLNSISAQITSVIKHKIDEERVKENERKFRLLFESANDAIFLMKENRFIECNKKTLEMFGCKREDIIGETPVMFSPERQPDGELSEKKANANINAAFQGKPERFEWLHTKLDGTPFYAEVNLNVFSLKGENYLQAIVRDISERKKAEESLRESEKRYKTLIHNIHDVVFQLSPLGYIQYVSPKVEELYGYKIQDLIGKHLKKTTPLNEVPKALDALKRFLSREEIKNFEINQLDNEGRIFFTEINATLVKKEGKIVAVQGVMRDITERKKAELQIQQRTEDLTLINTLNTMLNKGEGFDRIFSHVSSEVMNNFSCQTMSIMTLTNDKEIIIIEKIAMNPVLLKRLEKLVNSRARKHQVKLQKDGILMDVLFSSQPRILESKESIYRFIMDFSTKESTKRLIPEISRLLELKSIAIFPLISEKEVLGFSILFSKDRIEERNIDRLKTLFEQLTSIIVHKRVEEEMKKLSTTVEQLAETVVITDTDGNIQYVNPAFEQVSGYNREEVLGKNPKILKSGNHDDDFYKNLWDTIAGGNVWSGKLINKRKDGRLFEEKANISPIRDETGRITNYVAVKRDITRESQLEAQLIQSQRLETVGTLARGIAHDFNNILGTMQGYNDMAIEEAPENSKLFTYLKSIKMASSRAQDLVNQILTFSRDVKPERKPTSIQNLLNDSLEFLKPSISPGVKIVKRIKEKCEPVSADPSQIQQVILNLLANANQAMLDTGGELTIELQMVKFVKDGTKIHSELKEKNYVMLTIRDTGVGMDKNTVERIFEPFFTTKSVGEGTGLGLSVVYGIIKNHNGVIIVESKKGEGTAFEVYLPVTE